MKVFLRFSISGLLGLAITACLFFGMLSLLSGQKQQLKSEDNSINFSFVKDYKEAEIKPNKTIIKPEQQAVSQAPAMPSMNLDTPTDPGINLPMPNTQGKDFNILTEIDFPGLAGGTGLSGDQNGGLKSGMAPMYPPNEQMKKTQGWVKVLINVNEFGRVGSVSVLKAKPARVFNAATIKAVKKWQFHPKVVDGKAVPYQVTQTVEFKIDH